MKFIAATLVSCLFVAGCATNRTYIQRQYVGTPNPERVTVKGPDMSSVATAQVGESMIYTYNTLDLPAVTISDPVTVVTTYRADTRFRILLQPTTLIASAGDREGGRYFESKAGVMTAYSTASGFGEEERLPGGLHLDKSGRVSIWWQWSAGSANTELAPSTKIKESTVQVGTESSTFRRELVYVGRSQDAVHVLYREFKSDMARPAFNQELKYDIRTSNMIGYRQARFEVLDADNMGIKYRVIKHLD